MDIEQLAGTKLGNYELESLLGRGGMGVVYKARQISLNRPVAVKILPPHLSSDASFVKRFQREAQAIAHLRHQNILHIYDVGEKDGLHFFSMEYIEGQTLDEILKEKGRLEADEAVRILTQAAQGIEHAHKSNIIHRDIKPSNLILDEFNIVKVMDFGLARMVDERSKLTRSGTLMGTLHYMSPEQCRGEELDERTDIHSLGVVLYEMLTGKVPFDAPNEAALINKIINEEPAEVIRVNPSLSSSLSAAVSRMMAKDKHSRYASISEFLKDIRAFQALAASTVSATEKRLPSIAVLPFVNMSADPEQDYFCDGLAEELINALTQIRHLKVIARTSAFSFRGKEVDVRDIGKILDVGAILEGSVRKAGSRLRITAQLVDTSHGHHLWSERYDRQMDDIFAIQDEISEAIVKKLRPALFREEEAPLARRQTVGLETYDLYLKGRYFRNKFTEESLKKAIDLFKQAIAIDADYAAAYAGLADCFLLLPFYTPSPPREAYQKARRAAIRALEIDNTLAEAHTSLADIKSAHDWDWEGAEREYRQAIEFNPGYATAHEFYGIHLARLTRFEEAMEEINLALRLDPFSLHANTFLGGVSYYARQYDQAIGALQKTIEMDPNFPYAHAMLGIAYWQKGMSEEALEELFREKEISAGWNAPAECGIGALYALMGRRDEAVDILNTLLRRLDEEHIPPTLLSYICFALGEIDQGFDWLEKAYETGDNWLSYIKADPAQDDIRTDPRFMTLLKKMGLDT